MSRALVLISLVLLQLAAVGCKREPRFVFIDGGARGVESALLFANSTQYKKHTWEIVAIDANPGIKGLAHLPRVKLITNQEAADLPAWLSKNLREEDTVILSLDLQGAERPLISSILKQGAADLVDRLYVKWREDNRGAAELKQRMEAAGLWFMNDSFEDAHRERDLVDL